MATKHESDRRGRAITRLSHDQRGGVPATVISISALFLLVFVIIGTGIYVYGRVTAHAIANSAYQSARLYDATAADGRATGNDLLNQTRGAITNGEITVTRGAETVSVTITGESISVLPFITFPIEETITGPTERWAE